MKVIFVDGFVLHHVESVELNIGKHPTVCIKFIPGSYEFEVHTNGYYYEYVEALDCSFSVGDDDGPESKTSH